MSRTIPTLCAALALWASSALAETRGPETNLPLPRFVSMKAAEGNVRRGPSLTHRIDWVFKHKDMPLQVTAEFGHWRRVQDRDGLGGWMHYTLLSGTRTVIVLTERSLVDAPEEGALETVHLEPGVIARIDRCDPEWCRLNARGHRGWTVREGLWGLEEGEVLE